MTGQIVPSMPKPKCPQCGKPATPEALPFCSPRCQALDLNRWLSGAYVLPRPITPDDETEE
ncbi:MAG: DNA gyrase inhibitor YacG [Phyllobacteriaceae bacterium]|nr:DNA gyrase inhibitor YacG [Phyllobacteriaceae bacterium]